MIAGRIAYAKIKTVNLHNIWPEILDVRWSVSDGVQELQNGSADCALSERFTALDWLKDDEAFSPSLLWFELRNPLLANKSSQMKIPEIRIVRWADRERGAVRCDRPVA